MNLVRLAVFLTFATSPMLSSAYVVVDTQSSGTSTYTLVAADGGGGMTWAAAQSAADDLGGHLVTVNDGVENKFLHDTWGATRHLWIGLNDAAVEGTFVWDEGVVESYTNWQSPTEPSGTLSDTQDYAHIWAGTIGGPDGSGNYGRWNDAFHNQIGVFGYGIYGVVESYSTVPEPSALALLALGLVGIGARKRKLG